MPAGRPTIMDEITIQKLEDAFSNGATDLQACFLANISKSTLYNYQNEHPEFVERKDALKDNILYQAKLKIKSAILSEEKPDTAKWYLERKDKDFKPKSDLTTDGMPVIGGFNYIKPDGNDNTDNKTSPEATPCVGEITGQDD